MKILLASTTALLLTIVPAHAQLIGGGGALGGALGGSLGGTLQGPGSLGSTMDTVRSPVDTVGTSTLANGRSSARTAGSQNVNPKSGAVHADRSANAGLTGTAAQAVATPAQTMTGNGAGNGASNAAASGSGSASGHAAGSADAQLIGTDALTRTATGALTTARSTASDAAMTARGSAGMLGSAARQTAGSAASSAAGTGSGSAGGSASGLLSGASGNLAAAGSLAAAGDGAFSVSRGMSVLGPDGNRLGKVRSVIADAHGEVQAVLVKVDGATATLPAANFSGEGHALVSAMGKSQIKQQQAASKGAAPAPRQRTAGQGTAARSTARK